MVDIALENIWARVTNATDADIRWLDGILCYESWSNNGLQTYRLFDQFNKRFPAGMLAQVLKRAVQDKFEGIVVNDTRVVPCAVDPTADLSWLRDYQLEAVDTVIRKTRGIVHASTGSGKTEVMVGLTQKLPCRWLMLAHRGTLTENVADRYHLRTGAKAGRIADGVWELGDGALVCATFQTLNAGLKKGNKNVFDLLRGAEGLLVDEAHTAPADSYRRIIGMTPNAYYRVGLSGTPLARSDHRSVLAIGSLGRVIYRIKTETLIEAGLISKPTIEMRRCNQTSEKQDWASVYRELVVNSKARNQIVLDMVRDAPKPCIVFVTSLQHGKALAKAIQKTGTKGEFIAGNSSLDMRKRAVKRLQGGEIEALVATTIFNEGVDIPDLLSVVIASGGASTIQTLQKIGRGMRLTADKNTFHVFDIADRGHRWTERHAKARATAYRSEGHEVSTTG
jgi:superfamily II DNA or RNA helicase